MARHKRAKQVPKRAKEAADPDPNVTPHLSREPKGDSSSRLDASEGPAGDEEKQRVVEKLKERERDS